MTRERTFYIETDFGCRLVEGTTLEKAKEEALQEEGSEHFQSIRRATEDDVDWVRGMRGWVPKNPLVDPRQETCYDYGKESGNACPHCKRPLPL
jgi:hypothetical protein